MTSSILALNCPVQHYAWGKRGLKSAVARLSNVDDSKNTTPYAELWMGTHKKAPASLRTNEETLLSTYIKHDLPYLFKVLSVAKSLSIQAHPHIELAKELHERDAEHYPDGNHKPEMACAVTVFECMCGFRPYDELVYFLENIVELRDLIGGANVVQELKGKHDSNVLKRIFSTWMNASNDAIVRTLDVLMKRDRIPSYPNVDEDRQLNMHEIIHRLYAQYPNDPGVLAPFFLNTFRLQPGEAIFLGPNKPHAYLDGDCVECMACSDNVVRAGLTPKFRDVSTLCSMLEYVAEEPQIMHGNVVDTCMKTYTPPVNEFALAKIELQPNTNEYVVNAIKSDSILLIYDGYGKCDGNDVQYGQVYFIPANTSITLSTKDNKSNLLCFRCSEGIM